MERGATLIRRGESGFTLDGMKRERLGKRGKNDIGVGS